MATVRVAKQPAASSPEPAAKSISIDLRPSPDAATALARRDDIRGLIVHDRATHETALEIIQGHKALRRKIVEHWANIKRGVDTLKKNLLDLERKDLGPVDEIIDRAERLVLDFVNTERRREAEERERQRVAAEAQARADRAAELERQEAEALRLEEQSPTLTKRETVFVDAVYLGIVPHDAANGAGYASPGTAAEKLMRTPKILDALATRRTAAELRAQAEAIKAAPLVVVAPKVESNLGHVAGTSLRTSYKAEVVDPAAFAKAYLAGAMPPQAMTVNQVFLNQQATALKEHFEAAFPGCRLVVNQSIAG